MVLSRRKFFTGLAASALAAPAIVKASSLMPIKAVKVMPHDAILKLLEERMADCYRVMAEQMAESLYRGNHFGTKLWWDEAENPAPNYALIQNSGAFEIEA